MASADPRVSDKELAAINAAAVTREYRVKPHLGERAASLQTVMSADAGPGQTTELYLLLMGESRVGMRVER
jgi:hypothetical protein